MPPLDPREALPDEILNQVDGVPLPALYVGHLHVAKDISQAQAELEAALAQISEEEGDAPASEAAEAPDEPSDSGAAVAAD